MKASKALLARVSKLENEQSKNTVLTLNNGDTVVIGNGQWNRFAEMALFGGDDNEVECIVRNISLVHEPDSRLMEILMAVLI
jgi:hypothetical protein